MDAQAQAPVATAKSICRAALRAGRRPFGGLDRVSSRDRFGRPGGFSACRCWRRFTSQSDGVGLTIHGVSDKEILFGMDAPFSGASQGALRNGGRRKTSRMGEGGTMRQAVTVLSQFKKDEDGATLTMYTALIAILIVVVILAVREVGSWISDSGKQPRVPRDRCSPSASLAG